MELNLLNNTAYKKYFLSLGSDCWSIFRVCGVAKSENALSFAELARVFEVTSLAKLQNCKKYLNFFTVKECLL